MILAKGQPVGEVCLGKWYRLIASANRPVPSRYNRFQDLMLKLRHEKSLDLSVKASNAEEEGFEPPVPRGTTVFKTAAFDHSATPLSK